MWKKLQNLKWSLIDNNNKPSPNLASFREIQLCSALWVHACDWPVAIIWASSLVNTKHGDKRVSFDTSCCQGKAWLRKGSLVESKCLQRPIICCIFSGDFKNCYENNLVNSWKLRNLSLSISKQMIWVNIFLSVSKVHSNMFGFVCSRKRGIIIILSTFLKRLFIPWYWNTPLFISLNFNIVFQALCCDHIKNWRNGAYPFVWTEEW